jgi:cytochrome c peroxidase
LDIRAKNIQILGTTLLVIFLISLSGAYAAGKDEQLIEAAKEILGPLPNAMTSAQNPITPEKVKLGKILFYESRISIDGTVSCARCHPFSLHAADGLRKSIGNNCRVNPRNAPTILNAADQISEHWIGNRTSVEDQAKQAVTGPPSFGMPSYDSVENKLREFKEYAVLFRDAFPGDKEPVTVGNFAAAIGAFERTLVTPSSFDGFLKGNRAAMTDRQKDGLKTFLSAGCAACHAGPYAGGRIYQKFGIFGPYRDYTKSKETDDGRYAVTKRDSDKYVFKVPVLRNVEKTSPYFHDGSVEKLEEAVMIMGKIQLGKDLPQHEIEELVSFLEALTGKIPAYALEIPLLPSAE